jgi:hypothetical protein
MRLVKNVMAVIFIMMAIMLLVAIAIDFVGIAIILVNIFRGSLCFL